MFLSKWIKFVIINFQNLTMGIKESEKQKMEKSARIALLVTIIIALGMLIYYYTYVAQC